MKPRKRNRSRRWLFNTGFLLLAVTCGFAAGCDLDDNGDFDWDEIWDEVEDEFDDEFDD